VIRPDGRRYGRRLALVAALLVVVTLVACKNGDSNSAADERDLLEGALKAMVLQPDDLPEGFVLGESTFSSNQDVAADSEERRQQLESWGRQLGYEVAYQPDAEALQGSGPKGLNASSSLFRTEEGARRSYVDAEVAAVDTNWAANYAGLHDFMREEIDAAGRADQITWLRFSGFQPANTPPDALVTDDLIFFRIGRERGFLRVLATSNETTDRAYLQDTVDAWLTSMLERVRDALEESGLDTPSEGG
jgi:hypothetical protein